MKHIILPIVVLLAAVPVLAQTESQSISTCNLTVAQAPAMRGVRLGMTAQDLFTMFPEGHSADWVKSKLDAANEYPAMGGWWADLNTSAVNNTKDHSPISRFYVFLFDGRVVSMDVGYTVLNHNVPWGGVDNFIAKVSDAFHLPASSAWTTTNSSDQRVLYCREFTITGSTSGAAAQLTIQGLGFQDTIHDRMVAYEQATRRGFKP